MESSKNDKEMMGIHPQALIRNLKPVINHKTLQNTMNIFRTIIVLIEDRLDNSRSRSPTNTEMLSSRSLVKSDGPEVGLRESEWSRSGFGKVRIPTNNIQ